MFFHRLSLILLYTATILCVLWLIVYGSGYYSLPLTERPHSEWHESLKPSGIIGHGLGIIGSLLMLLLLLYSARKRLKFLRRAGNIRYWLNYHIWMGITGPLLVIFHTAFKLGGIVSISFWSMIAVALSGVLGRYLYIQIPRTLGGDELTAAELEEMDREMQREIKRKYGLDDEMIQRINRLAGSDQVEKMTGLRGILFWIRQDLSLPRRVSWLRRDILATTEMDHRELVTLSKIIKKKIRLRRRAAFLSTAHALLHHWHVIHKPFAIVMLLIMVVHVVVAVVFGYTWIF